MRRIPIGPADRLRILVVLRDVAPSLPREVRQRREDAAGQQVAFDFRKPEFHLIDPRGIRRREVQMHARIRVKERLDPFRLVRSQVIDDDVDLTSPWLRGYDVAEKLDKGIAGVKW